MEVGLVNGETFRRQATTPILIPNLSPKRVRPVHCVRFRSKTDIFEEEEKSKDEWEDVDHTDSDRSMAEDDGTLSTMTLRPNTHLRTYSRLYRLGILAFLLAVTLPLLQNNPVVGGNGHTLFGARGGVIPSTPVEYMEEVAEFLRRGDTPTDICARWSHQSMSILFQNIGRNADETQPPWSTELSIFTVAGKPLMPSKRVILGVSALNDRRSIQLTSHSHR